VHHFGRARAGTFELQLILHDWVSHGSRPPLPTVASGIAAALAAGEDKEGGLTGGAVLWRVGGSGGSSCLEDRLPAAHPASTKTSKAAANLMILI